MHIRSFMFLSAIAFIYTGVEAKSTTLPPLVCQNKKCYPATAALTRESLFNKIQNLVNGNINKNILICEANPQSKMCLTKGFKLPLHTNTLSTEIDFLSAKITSNQGIENSTGSDLIVDYKVKSNHIFPNCQTAPTRLGVLQENTIQIIAPDFSCTFGKTTQTTLSLSYHVDYINFDDGTIGAYYSITATKQLYGQKSGYVLFRFLQPGAGNLNEPFPMHQALQNYKINQQKIHTNMTPVWMKPTPVLNIETPQVITHPNGNLSIQGQNLGVAQQPTPSVPSTTGLITQEKNILPPVNGVRKTVTIKKKIYQEGKPVTYEEDVRRYVQENENAPLVEEQKLMQELKKAEPAIPQMPKPTNALSTPLPTLAPDYLIPQEIILTPEEIEQIQTELPSDKIIQQTSAVSQNQPMEKSNEPSGLKKLWGKIENFLYF